jgi:hypothetical protein
MTNNREFIKNVLDNLKFEDKLDMNNITRENDYNKRLAIKANLKYLADLMGMYKSISSLNEADSINLEKEVGSNKTDFLSSIEKHYEYQLDLFRRYGMNVSKFPKNLEDLTKKDDRR